MIYYFKDDFLGQTRTFIRILFGNNQLEQDWAELKLATHALPTSDYRVHGTQNNRLEGPQCWIVGMCLLALWAADLT